MPTTKWIKSDSQSFYEMLKQLPDRTDRPMRDVVHGSTVAMPPQPAAPAQRPLSKADAEALAQALADLQHARQHAQAATFATAATSGALSKARRRDLLGMTAAGQAIVHQEDMTAAATFTAPGGLSDARRRELLGTTPLGQAILARERKDGTNR